jgi:hypothetical protein
LKEELRWHLKVCSGVSSRIKRRKNTATDTTRIKLFFQFSLGLLSKEFKS